MQYESTLTMDHDDVVEACIEWAMKHHSIKALAGSATASSTLTDEPTQRQHKVKIVFKNVVKT